MAPGAVQRQTSGAGGPAAAQRSLRGRSGHPEEPAAGGQLQTVGGANSCDMSLLQFNCKAIILFCLAQIRDHTTIVMSEETYAYTFKISCGFRRNVKKARISGTHNI